MEAYETHEHDVVVVGAGGAGLWAAIEASAQGASVGLVCKSLLGKAHTVMAEGGIAAAMASVDPEDSWQTHFRDTMRGGKMLNHWRMAQIHAQESPDRVRELESWGALFDRTPDGTVLQRPFGGHRWRRLCHVGDRTGLEMIRTLQDRAVHMDIPVYMECTLTHLLKDGDRIAGVFGYWRESGRFVLFKAKSVILATGGIGMAYKITSNSWEYTGDGMNMAYDAGAELVDMEFVQFHPTGMIWPPGVIGILVTEGVRGDGGVLKNSEGERFMFRYIPEMFRSETAETEEEAERWLARDKTARRPPELLTRDVVARAILNEVKEGRGSEHGGVYLDISHKPSDYVKKKLPSMYVQFLELADVDITQQPMEVGPTTHYMMGGVRVDPESAATTVPGLFAAGEAAAGLHGANRLGGNSLSDLLVFGRRAGLGAVEYARGLDSEPKVYSEEIQRAAGEMLQPFERSTGEDPYAIHRDLREIMQQYVGIIRTEADLRTGLERLAELKERAAHVKVESSRLYHPGWHLTRDLTSMITSSEAIALSALERKESRGAHTRADFPDSDPELGKGNTVVYRQGDHMKVKFVPLPEMPEELKRLLGDSK